VAVGNVFNRRRDETRLMPPYEPREVRTSAFLWLVAVAAGIFETGLVVIARVGDGQGLSSDLMSGVLLRLAVFTIAGILIVYLRQGRNWARLSLALLLGVLGTLSLVIGPVEWLLQGHALVDAARNASLTTVLFASSRVTHVTAVLSATFFMFRPGAAGYFRRLSKVERYSSVSS
jgi:hypothetical protein